MGINTWIYIGVICCIVFDIYIISKDKKYIKKEMIKFQKRVNCIEEKINFLMEKK